MNQVLGMRIDVAVNLLDAAQSMNDAVAKSQARADRGSVASMGNGYSAERITSMDGLRSFLGGGR